MSRRNKVLLALVGLVLAAQLLRPAKTTPTIDPQRELSAHTQMPLQVSDLLNRGCSDCHSYRTTWPWYSQIAPFSWIIADDVNEGRRHVNFSDWAQYDPKRADHKLDQICDEVKDGGMPLTSYKWMHAGARLTEHERAEICVWVGAERQRIAQGDPPKQGLWSLPPLSETSLTISEQNAALLGVIGQYHALRTLSITCIEDLQSLPDSIGDLTSLVELQINNGNGCSMNPVLPEAIGKLHSLTKLVLNGAQDPRPVGDHYGPQPTERHNFPHSMSELKKLKYLDMSRNGFEQVPLFVKDLPRLEELRFEFNALKQLPPSIADLRALRTLRLNGNDLQDLPDSLNSLPQLKKVSLGYNCKITQNPAKIQELKRRFPRITFDFEDDYDCPTTT